jgi:hypothetical protein
MILDKQDLPAHPLAKIFPPISEPQYLALKADIERNGLLTDIVTCEGQILEGLSRYRVCLEIGIPPRLREYDGSDPLAFVMSSNLHRRHLTESQRALVAGQIVRLKVATGQGKPQICGLTHSRAAKMFAVSPRQVDKATALLSAVERGQAIPELLESVRNGDRRLHQAEKLSRTSLAEQRQALVPAVRRRYGAQPSERKDWDGAFNQVALRLFRSCSSALRLAFEADAAGELTPERWKLLVDFCLEAMERLTVTTEQIAVGKLTPHRWKGLVDSYREAMERLMQTTEQLEGINRMPFDDV